MINLEGGNVLDGSEYSVLRRRMGINEDLSKKIDIIGRRLTPHLKEEKNGDEFSDCY